MVAILSRGKWVNGDSYMIVATDWTDGVCGCIYIAICQKEIWVNIGSGNDLLTDDTKPLPGPMLTDHDWS